MANLTVQNLTSAPVYVRDLYVTIQSNASISTTRYASDLPRMYGLQALMAAGTVAASVQYDATEQAAGLMAQGLPQVPATGVSPEMVVRVPLVGGGVITDTKVYPLAGLPAAKIRILNVYADISNSGGGSGLLQVCSAAAGGGTLCAEIAAAATGRANQDNAVTTSVVLTNSSTVGLWVHQTDAAVVGEVFIVLRPEI